MNHGPYCIPPDEVGASGMCVCDGTDETIATMRRQYAIDEAARWLLNPDLGTPQERAERAVAILRETTGDSEKSDG